MNNFIRTAILLLSVCLVSQPVIVNAGVADTVKRVCTKNAVGVLACWLTATTSEAVVEHHVQNHIERQPDNQIDPRKQAILWEMEDLKRRFDSFSPAQQALHEEEMNAEYQRLYWKLRNIR